MKEKFELKVPSVDKNTYQKVIDTSFKQLGVQTIQQQLEQQPTVEEFFQMYND